MTTETARLLAQALLERKVAEDGLVRLLGRNDIEPPPRVLRAMTTLAETFVHEERVINRIVFEAVDDE